MSSLLRTGIVLEILRKKSCAGSGVSVITEPSYFASAVDLPHFSCWNSPEFACFPHGFLADPRPAPALVDHLGSSCMEPKSSSVECFVQVDVFPKQTQEPRYIVWWMAVDGVAFPWTPFPSLGSQNPWPTLGLLRSTDAGPRSRPSQWQCPTRDRWPWPHPASSSWRAASLPPAVAMKYVLWTKKPEVGLLYHLWITYGPMGL